MKHHTQGFSLVWVLIIGVLLMLMATSMIQGASTISRTSGSVSRGSLITVAERDTLSYSQRLLEANASRLIRTLPAPNGNPDQLTSSLQSSVDAWCNRNPLSIDIRVYFTQTACGVPLPADVSLEAVQVTQTGSDLTLASIPFVIVVPTPGRVLARSGTLTATYGSAPVSIYALLTRDDLTLDAHVSTRGNVHTDGHLTVQSGTQVAGLVSSSNCTVPTVACTGLSTVTLSDATVPVMSITPTPAHPGIMAGMLTLGQTGETAALTVNATGGLNVTATEVTLGVLGNGNQYLRTCTASLICTEFAADQQGNLYQGDTSTRPLITNWSGVVNVVTDGTALTIRPQQDGAPSIVRPLSLNVSSPVVIDGNVTYDSTSCAGDVCSAEGDTELFSVTAPTITATERVERIHGTLITGTFTNKGNLTLFGSLYGQPGGAVSLLIQQDARALRGLAAPGVPFLAAQWREATTVMTR